MEQNTQPTFGKYIPHHLRDALTQAYQKKQGDVETEEKPQTPEVQQEETQSAQPNAEQKTEAQTEPQPTAETETAPHSEEDNDVKAWKGRLKKEQAERQQLNARLIEESEARQRAEERLRELEQAKTQPNHTAVSAIQPTQTTTNTDPKGLSDVELEEVRMINPDLYLRLKAAREANAQGSAAMPTESVQQPVQLNQSVAPAQPTAMQNLQSERERIWYAEVQREIPEIQGLLGDPNFVEFARGKTDWTGASGLDLIQQAGNAKDVRRIPVIRTLLDEYLQSKQQAPTPVTAAPQKSAMVKAKVNQPKQMTKQDEAQAEMMMRQGKTEELKKFLARFKQ